VDMDNSAQRMLLLNISSGSPVSVQEILEAIQVLEKQKETESNQATLAGAWFLLWTSGTKKYQESSEDLIKPISKISSVIQRFDLDRSWIENEVRFPYFSLIVEGPFVCSAEKKIQFTFQSVRLKVGFLPEIKIPFGTWASGWLRTTYLDQELHIERGDRGGVSVYRKGAF
jgi:PAP_fibrillin